MQSCSPQGPGMTGLRDEECIQDQGQLPVCSLKQTQHFTHVLCDESSQHSVLNTQKINWYFTKKKNKILINNLIWQKTGNVRHQAGGCVVVRQPTQFSRAQGYCFIMGLFLLVTSDCFDSLGVETRKTYEYFFKSRCLSQSWVTNIYF